MSVLIVRAGCLPEDLAPASEMSVGLTLLGAGTDGLWGVKVPVEVSVITAEMRWWTGAAGSKRVTSGVKADTLQTHRTLWLQGEDF